MASVLTIIQGDDIIGTVPDADHIGKALEHGKPGRYVVEESSMAGELLPSGYPCQPSRRLCGEFSDRRLLVNDSGTCDRQERGYSSIGLCFFQLPLARMKQVYLSVQWAFPQESFLEQQVRV